MKLYGHDCCRNCGHEFEPEELRYRANDGYDYCTESECGIKKWQEERNAPVTN